MTRTPVTSPSSTKNVAENRMMETGRSSAPTPKESSRNSPVAWVTGALLGETIEMTMAIATTIMRTAMTSPTALPLTGAGGTGTEPRRLAPAPALLFFLFCAFDLRPEDI